MQYIAVRLFSSILQLSKCWLNSIAVIISAGQPERNNLFKYETSTESEGQGPTGSRYPTRPELFFKYPTRPDPKNENDWVPGN